MLLSIIIVKGCHPQLFLGFINIPLLNDSYRDVQERLLYRGLLVSHETIREWSIKFSSHFKDVIKKREPKTSEKWHLDEQTLRVNGNPYILWRAVDSEGYELDVFCRNDAIKKQLFVF